MIERSLCFTRHRVWGFSIGSGSWKRSWSSALMGLYRFWDEAHVILLDNDYTFVYELVVEHCEAFRLVESLQMLKKGSFYNEAEKSDS